MLGARPVGDGLVEFGVWAPRARAVSVLGSALEPSGDEGMFSGRVAASSAADYVFTLDDGREWPDPCSRFQPSGVRAPSRVVDLAESSIRDGPTLDLEHLVLYELHVGRFSRDGTFDGVRRRLGELAEAGITAIELMPVATFPGDRGWGYDGLYLSAVHPAYGGPEALARFVDAAHREGLAVILDVVYNHLGPGSEAITAFGPYVTDRHETPWGGAIDFSQPVVREWAIQNAELWVHDFRIDGLRLDAVFAIFDDSAKHVLAELRERL